MTPEQAAGELARAADRDTLRAAGMTTPEHHAALRLVVEHDRTCPQCVDPLRWRCPEGADLELSAAIVGGRR